VYQLNSSGKYFAFKEQLKYAVVKIVREKYLKTVKFQDSDERKVKQAPLYLDQNFSSHDPCFTFVLCLLSVPAASLIVLVTLFSHHIVTCPVSLFTTTSCSSL